jgi:hypothetical protein
VFRKSISIYLLALARIYLFCTVYLIIQPVSTYNWVDLPVSIYLILAPFWNLESNSIYFIGFLYIYLKKVLLTIDSPRYRISGNEWGSY